MTERPKGTVLAARKSSSIRGNRRRNSSATAARLRMTEKALGWVMVGSVRDTRTKQEQSQGSRSSRSRPSAPIGQVLGQVLGQVFGFSAASSEEAAKGLNTVVT
jgi:hypothetical protein